MEPKPIQPEPQMQTYQLIKRGGKISRCNGCGEEFDKTDGSLRILGRYELDWYVHVNKQEGTKVYKSTSRNMYYHIQRRCILARRPLINFNDMEVCCVLGEENDELNKMIKEHFGTDLTLFSEG